MARYRGPKNRISRRLGVNLFGRGDNKGVAKRSYPPGQHGRTRRGKKSDYAELLTEKQKARYMYGLTEKQFSNYYKKAIASKGVTGDELMILLERRLDNVVFRSGMANTRDQARQMVSHGLITLNGQKVTIPSIQVNMGDKFEVKESRKNSPLFEEVKKGKNISARWINFDNKKLSGEVIALPTNEDYDPIINPQSIVEYYSK